MSSHKVWNHWRVGAISLWACMGIMGMNATAADNSLVMSVSPPSNTLVMPRSMFTVTWTVQNTGTTTWTPTQNGYTMNLVGKDSMGAIPVYTNTYSKHYEPNAIIDSGKSIAPGQQATFRMTFIAPETPGAVTDIFQLNNASSVFFGPQFAAQVVVAQAGSTNQYDRAKAVSYANNYAGYIVGDGYFWTNGSDYYYYGAGQPVPTTLVGDDCAHFVSCCIGSQGTQWGGGLKIPSRVPPTYGEPGAGALVNTVLIAPGYATEVSSLSEMSPGDVIGWNWEGDTDIADLDHVTIYLGNGLTGSHAESCLDVSANTWYQSGESEAVRHLIHIYDAPTITCGKAGGNLVLSWGTNWTGYVLQSSASLAAGSAWSNVKTAPTKVGRLNQLTTPMSQADAYFRLVLP